MKFKLDEDLSPELSSRGPMFEQAFKNIDDVLWKEAGGKGASLFGHDNALLGLHPPLRRRQLQPRGSTSSPQPDPFAQ